MTKSDRRFLLYNNVYNSILIFCTEENLSIFSEHSVCSMDGTFKIVPEWYQQMFTIHVFIAGKLVPLVYWLTVHKDLSTYREIFDNLILKAAALGVVLQPQTVICDFETALIRTLLATFLGCTYKVVTSISASSCEESDGSWDANQHIHEAATKKKSKCCWQRLFCCLMMYLLPWSCLAEMLRVQ
ncbi:hypothetical protein T06_6643 [Trichinella sp. T6]|nr:hypothetical protein T06_6643 [Trichinella sp. T6]